MLNKNKFLGFPEVWFFKWTALYRQNILMCHCSCGSLKVYWGFSIGVFKISYYLSHKMTCKISAFSPSLLWNLCLPFMLVSWLLNFASTRLGNNGASCAKAPSCSQNATMSKYTWGISRASVDSRSHRVKTRDLLVWCVYTEETVCLYDCKLGVP